MAQSPYAAAAEDLLRGIAVVFANSDAVAQSPELISFTYADVRCLVCEPFGDNSRYWIGPSSDVDFGMSDLRELQKAFARASSAKARSLLARLFSQ